MPSWLKCSPELVAEMLFGECDKHPKIVNADWVDGYLRLALDGDEIPNSLEIRAEFSSRPRVVVKFFPIEQEIALADS